MGLFGCSHEWASDHDGDHTCKKCGKLGARHHNWARNHGVTKKARVWDGVKGYDVTEVQETCVICGQTRWV